MWDFKSSGREAGKLLLKKGKTIKRLHASDFFLCGNCTKAKFQLKNTHLPQVMRMVGGAGILC
jgi:hypothetical protein